MPMNNTEISLVIAAQNGDTGCFEQLYELYYEKIFAIALSILKNSADAEDALQLTFVSAWQYLYRLENPAAFNTWLQRIAVNQCHSMLRRRRPESSMDDEGEDGEVMQLESDLMLPEQYAERDDLAIRLQWIINGLSDVQRETVMLYYFNEMSIGEIAEIMDCSEGTVKSRLFLARKALKTEIEEIERKTGERFYGVAFIPFGTIFVGQVKNAMIPKYAAMDIFGQVYSAVFHTPYLPPQQVQPAPAQNAPYDPHPAGHSSSASGRAASAAGHGARHAASSAAKASVPLWGKITAAVLAFTIAVTGAAVAVTQLLPKRDADKKPSATESPEVSAYAVGDTIKFGKFEQNNDISDGTEDIIWRILDNTDGRIFVLSEYALDSLSYADYAPGDRWSEAGLRDYLNDAFYHTAFSETEQRCICDTYILSDEGHDRELPQTYVMQKVTMMPAVRPDTVVIDKLFLLNDYEVTRYVVENTVAVATDYAIANGVDTDENNRAVWWLRSHTTSDEICVADMNGHVDIDNGGSSIDTYSLRPAMWIDTNALSNNENAEDVVQPVDTSYLNVSLNSFLKNFNYRGFRADGFENEFDSTDLNETNILFDILTWFPCVNYSVYSDDLAAANWEPISQDSPSVDVIRQSESNYYVKLDAAAIDDIAKRIFQCDDEDIERMRNSFPNTDWLSCAYSDGFYYATRSPSEFIYDPCYYHPVRAEYREGYYYFTLDYYRNKTHTPVEVNIGETPPDNRYYVKVSLLPHEGTPWWSLYYYSSTPSDEWQNTADDVNVPSDGEAEDFTAVAGKYVYTPGSNFGTSMILNADGSFTGTYSDGHYGIEGEGYSMTLSYCSFSGSFVNLKKTGEHTYTFELESLTYDHPTGTEEIISDSETGRGVLYQYTDPEGLSMNNRKFTYYDADTPLSDVPQKYSNWIHQFRIGSTTDTLDCDYLFQTEYSFGWHEMD